jgi:UV excision repair protein RAD23
VKTIIEAANNEFEAPKLKLIHSGKVLKDEQTLTECGIKENDFLVVMIMKVISFSEVSFLANELTSF